MLLRVPIQAAEKFLITKSQLESLLSHESCSQFLKRAELLTPMNIGPCRISASLCTK